jgi:glycosyltransferase involved in cell wall biosynthesis
MQSRQITNVSSVPGFNVIGYASGNLGLGVYARSVIDSILARGFPVAVLDLDPGFGRKGFEPRHQEWFVESPEALPYSVNCFVLPPHSLDDAAARFASLVSRPGVLNAAFSMWELPQVSEVWHPALQMFDVLVAGSPFIRHSFAFSLPEAMVIDAPLFLPLRSRVTADRKRFGLAGDICYCIASFEPLSAGERKNVKAVVAAFQAAVIAAPNLNLIIKVNNPSPRGVEHRALAQLRQACAGIPGVRFITDTLPHSDVLSLYASCDIYVSMHRSEGYGLGMYEAMQLGKPVIATGWSGNMAFMDHTSACLTSYHLVPVPVWRGGVAYISRGYRRPVQWAEPKVDDAAKWLARLASSPELRREKGAAALAAIAAYQQVAERAAFLDELRAIHDQKRMLDPDSTRLARYLPLAMQRRAKRARLEKSVLHKAVRKVRKIFR